MLQHPFWQKLFFGLTFIVVRVPCLLRQLEVSFFFFSVENGNDFGVFLATVFPLYLI